MILTVQGFIIGLFLLQAFVFLKWSKNMSDWQKCQDKAINDIFTLIQKDMEINLLRGQCDRDGRTGANAVK